MNIYQEHGYENRKDYLENLAVENGVPLATVITLADLLGESEDFDGLVTAVEDASEDMEDELSEEDFEDE